MLCQNCNKKEANVNYTQIINGDKKEMHLCDKCARKLGINVAFKMPSFNFSNLFGSMFDDDIMFDFMPNLMGNRGLLSDGFDSDFEDFFGTKKLGYAKNSDTTGDELDTLLKRMHNENVNDECNELKDKRQEKNNIKINKKEQTVEGKIEELQLRLKKEIEEERYEDAAKTRDEIKKLQK